MTLAQLALTIALLGALGLIAGRFGLSAIPAYLLAGLLLGPHEPHLTSLIEPYRKEDQDEVLECLKKQGGLEACSLAFYKDGDIGDDGEWDNWRLEGPSFVWYFRGYPHVHVWVNVADDASVKLNAQG